MESRGSFRSVDDAAEGERAGKRRRLDIVKAPGEANDMSAPPARFGPPAPPAPPAAGGDAANDAAAMPPPAWLPAPSTSGGTRRIAFVHSTELEAVCNLLPINKNRASIVFQLIRACGLLRLCRVVPPELASMAQFADFHDEAYVAALRQAAEGTLDVACAERFGLVDDCPPFRGLDTYCRAVWGASVTAADQLARGLADVAVAWSGGRHHARKAEAAGYCYVNDCVAAVLRLRRDKRRVLYVDVDAHHGDAVQEAFEHSPFVMTVSIHKHARGFFPSTGALEERGRGKGKYFTMNLPLRGGASDGTLREVFDRVVMRVVEVLTPDAIVLQCGADGLARDPCRALNLTPRALAHCVRKLRETGTPLLVLGGGGYNSADTARAWAAATAAAIGPHAEAALPGDVPDHEYFPCYGPDFRMDVRAREGVVDENAGEGLTQLVAAGLDHVAELAERLRGRR